ncbi:hypothetical protein GH742_11385 [Legionella sp. MW5194]|nr:hypothetical protein [Legionella sp. MW5194]QRN04431.1 hypothetical protein GH742_11385 [Legionella sp. MW5194]
MLSQEAGKLKTCLEFLFPGSLNPINTVIQLDHNGFYLAKWGFHGGMFYG